MSDVRIQKGSVLVYRLFDLAEEIDLAEVQRLLREGTGRVNLRPSRATRSRAIVVRNPPVTFNLGESQVRIGSQLLRIETYAKVWDYGVISIIFQHRIAEATPWQDLLDEAVLLEDDNNIDEVAERRASELADVLQSALSDRHAWNVIEDYVIYFFEQVDGIDKAADLLEKVDVAALILAERAEELADASRRPILDSVFQYGMHDMAIVDWNSAIVLEPTGSRDIADVLEFALTHLLEMRYYDDLLDRRLDAVYDTFQVRRGRLFGRRIAALTREANARYIELSEFIERVENSLKVVGDLYLATIFRAAGRRFRLADWQQNVTRKMNLLARVSDLLQGEVDVTRSHWLEIIIILLIAYEVGAAFFQ